MRTALRLAPLFLAIGCGSDPVMDITGSVDGTKFTAATAYFGGPFIAFVSTEDECMDFAWVQKSIDENDDPPVERDIKALLFTFEESDVTKGNYSVEGNAPVDARFIMVESGALTVHRAREGFLDVTELEATDSAAGNFQLGFENGELNGDFDIEWCNNLKSKY